MDQYPYLREKPRPPSPLSPNATRVTTSALALCSCASMPPICDKLLYSHISTDNFPQLLKNVHLPSMRRRLAHTRSLRLEYSVKGVDPTYLTLFRSGNAHSSVTGVSAFWDQYGRLEKDGIYDQTIAECQAEVDALTDVLRKAIRVGGAKAICGKLEAMAIAGIYGRKDEQWADFDVWHSSRRNISPTLQVGHLFDEFLTSGNLRYACYRDPEGPLSMDCISHASDSKYPKTSNYARTIHFGAGVNHLPIRLGSRMRWVSDAPSTSDWAVTLTKILRQVQSILKARKQYLGVRPYKDVAKVDVYCSASQIDAELFAVEAVEDEQLQIADYLTPLLDAGLTLEETDPVSLTYNQRQTIIKGLGAAVQKLLREDSGFKDSVKWYETADYGACPACGSCPPA